MHKSSMYLEMSLCMEATLDQPFLLILLQSNRLISILYTEIHTIVKKKEIHLRKQNPSLIVHSNLLVTSIPTDNNL